MCRSLFVIPLLALAGMALPCHAQEDHLDTISGPITAIASPTTFDVSGRHISLSPNTEFGIRAKGDAGAANAQEDPHDSAHITAKDLFVGERVQLAGRSHPGKHSFVADKVTIVPPAGNVNGIAIIDLIPAAQPANPNERIVRADGYLLRITPNSKLTFAAPLNSVADISANQWIEYSGAIQQDGAILITSAAITPNTVSKTEDKLRKKTDYDPSKVPYVDGMSDETADYIATIYYLMGPWPDAAMQARVQRIGISLVPGYQRALPDSDPTKINFRFSVVDEKNLHDPMSLPSGVILVPHQLIERLQNDDQLAGLLADSVAQVIEKDSLAKQFIHDKVVASGLILGGILSNVVTEAAASHAYAADPSRTTRVSLCLMHDAGYDVFQAPLAWWHLADKKGKPLEQVGLPSRAENLYTTLGLAWRNMQ